MPSDAAQAPRRRFEDPLLAAAVLGGGLPEAAEDELWRAGFSYHADEVAERHLRQAEALAPGHVAVLIGLYRFYFYKGRLADALGVAERCLSLVTDAIGARPDWRAVGAQDADFRSFEAASPRFFLFALKGYAYLQMRLGRGELGREAVLKLLELDPSDKVGARVLLEVLERAGGDDEG
jgi:tetratricopeptide (TPR) repeat protein